MSIIIGFSKARSPWKLGSKAIQLADARDYSHCYIRYVCSDTNVELIAQASHGFVNLVFSDTFKIDNIIVKEYLLECTDAERLSMLIFIQKSLGKPYSKFQLLCIAIKKVFKFEIKSYNKDKYYICSEFAARVCSISGIQVPDNLDYIEPTDLDTILSMVKTAVLI